MKTFTDTEKQQLQAKIQDEQERQQVLKENIQIEKESKRSRGIISTVLSTVSYWSFFACLPSV